MPPNPGDDNDTVISTAEGIKIKVEQLQHRLQCCVENLEMVSVGSAAETQPNAQPQQRKLTTQVTIGNSRYSGSGMSGAQGGSFGRGAGPTEKRSSSDTSGVNDSGMERHEDASFARPAQNGLPVAGSVGGSPSDDAEWEEGMAGDDYDPGVDYEAGIEPDMDEFEPLDGVSTPSGRPRYGADGSQQPPGQSPGPVSVGSALQALKQNLSPHVRTSLKGVNVPTHGMELREQYSKAINDSVQRRVMGRAEDFHKSGGSLDVGDVGAGPAALRTGSATFGTPQRHRLGMESGMGISASSGVALGSPATRSTLASAHKTREEELVQSQSLHSPARAGLGIGMLRKGGDDPASASLSLSRRDSVSTQRPAPAKSKIPPPPVPSRLVGSTQPADPLPAPPDLTALEAQSTLDQALESEQSAPNSPALTHIKDRVHRLDSSREALIQSVASCASTSSAGRGWRFTAADDRGTVAVSIGSGFGDGDNSCAATPRSPAAERISPLASAESLPQGALGFTPPTSAPVGSHGNSGSSQLVGFVLSAHILPAGKADSSAAEPPPIVGFVPPAHAFPAGNSNAAPAQPPPVIGFMPPPEAFFPQPNPSPEPAPPIVGFMPPPEAFTATKASISQAQVIGFVPPFQVEDTAAAGATAQHHSSGWGRDVTEPRLDTAVLQMAGRGGSGGGAKQLCMIPAGEFSFGINAQVFSSTSKLPLRSSGSSSSGAGVRPQVETQSSSRRDPDAAVQYSGDADLHAGSGVPALQVLTRLRASASSRLSRMGSGASRDQVTEDGQELEVEDGVQGKLPWEDSSDDEADDATAVGPASSSGEAEPSELRRPSASPPTTLRLLPPRVTVPSPHRAEPMSESGRDTPDGESISPLPVAGIQAPSFSDYSRVASPAALRASRPSVTAIIEAPAPPAPAPAPAPPPFLLPPPPPPSASGSRVPSPPRSAAHSSPLGSPRSEIIEPGTFGGQFPVSQRSVSNSGVSITISESDIARAGGIAPALLEVVRERFKQKGFHNLVQLAASSAVAAEASGAGAVRGETLAERIVARVETFQSMRRLSHGGAGLVASLSSGAEVEEGHGHDNPSPLRHPDALNRSASSTSHSGTVYGSLMNRPPAGASTCVSAASSNKSMADNGLRMSVTSPPLRDLQAKAGPAPASYSQGMEGTRGGTSRIPAPGQAASKTTPGAAAAAAAAGAAGTQARGDAPLAATSSPSPGTSPQRSPTRATSPCGPPRPFDAAAAAAAVAASSPAKVEQGTQTPSQPTPSPPPATTEGPLVPQGTARDFFLATTLPLAAARIADGRGGGSGWPSSSTATDDKLLPPDIPAICTAADFFRGAASRATINTSAMASPLRELPPGVTFASPFLAATQQGAAALSPHGRSVRLGREVLSLNGTPSTASRQRRQSASGRAVVSAGGLMGRASSSGRRVSNGGGRVVIDDEPVDMATRSSSRTMSYNNRRMSMGASTGATTRVAFDDSEAAGGGRGSAGPSPLAGVPHAALPAASPRRGLTREVLMHLAHLPSEGRHPFETTTEEEREEQERQARRRARQRRASGPGEGRVSGLSLDPSQQAPRSGAREDAYSPPSLPGQPPANDSQPHQHHTASVHPVPSNQLHAHFNLGAAPPPAGPEGGRSSGLPQARQLAAVLAEAYPQAGGIESPATAAAPGDLIALPPLSLDAPDMPEPGGGDALGCARTSAVVAQLPHDTFFIPQSPTWGRRGGQQAEPLSPDAAAAAAAGGVPVGVGASATRAVQDRAGVVPSQLLRLAHTSPGELAGAGKRSLSKGRSRRSSTAATQGDSWDTSDGGGSSLEGEGAGDGRHSRLGQRTAAGVDHRKSQAKNPAGQHGAGGTDGDAPATLSVSGGRKTGISSRPDGLGQRVQLSTFREAVSVGQRTGGGAPRRGHGPTTSDEEDDIPTMPYDVYDVDDTDVADLDERDPSFRSASRGGALSPSSTAASVLSQARYVATARAHRSVSEANSTKRQSSGVPLLTEEEEEGGEQEHAVGTAARGGSAGVRERVDTARSRGASTPRQEAPRGSSRVMQAAAEHSGNDTEPPAEHRRAVRIQDHEGGQSRRGPSVVTLEDGDTNDDGEVPMQRASVGGFSSGAAGRGTESGAAVAPGESPGRSASGGQEGTSASAAAAAPIAGGAVPRTPNGTRIQQSLQRLLDHRASAAAAEQARGSGGQYFPGATPRAEGHVVQRAAIAAAQLDNLSHHQAATLAALVPGADGSRSSRSPSVTATAGGTTEADAADREALLLRSRNLLSAGTDAAPQAFEDKAAPRSRLQQARPKPLGIAPEHRRIRRRSAGEGSTYSSDVPPEDPSALMSPNYTQDMAEEEYGWDVATGDTDVDNLTSPRGRRTPRGGVGGGAHMRRNRKAAPASPRPPLPFDPSEVPSAGVNDVSASYTGELEEQELREMLAELGGLLPSGAWLPQNAGQEGHSAVLDALPSTFSAEKEPSFSLDPQPRSSRAAAGTVGTSGRVVVPAGGNSGAALRPLMSAAPLSAAPAAPSHSVTEALFLALTSPRAEEDRAKSAPRRHESGGGASRGLRLAVTSPRSGSVGRGSLGALGGTTSPPRSTSWVSPWSVSPESSPGREDAAVAGAGSNRVVSLATSPSAGKPSSTVPKWLAAALGSPPGTGSARTAVAQGQTGPASGRSHSGVTAGSSSSSRSEPRKPSPRPSAAAATASAAASSAARATTVSAALAELLASVRPITRPSAKALPAPAAVTPTAAGNGATRSLSALSHPGSGPSLVAQAGAPQPHGEDQLRHPQPGSGSTAASGSSRASTRGSASSEPDPELRRLLLSAWSRWYMRRCHGVGLIGGAEERGDSEGEAAAVVEAAQAQAQAQARLQTLARAHSWASSVSWEAVASSPGMQEAANFSRLFITFTRWLGHARSSRQAGTTCAPRGAQPRASPARDTYPPSNGFNIAPSKPRTTAQPSRTAAAAPPPPYQALRIQSSGPRVAGAGGHKDSGVQPATAAWPAASGSSQPGTSALSSALLSLLASPPPHPAQPAPSSQPAAAPTGPAVAAAMLPGPGPARVNNPVAALLAGFSHHPAGRTGRNALSTPTVSRSSGVRQVPTHPQPPQRHPSNVSAVVGEDGSWVQALSHTTTAQPSSHLALAAARPPSSPSALPVGSYVAAATQREQQHRSAGPNIARGFPGGPGPATAAPKLGSTSASSLGPPAADDLESLFAMHLLNGLGAGSEGVILAGLQLASGGAFGSGKGAAGFASRDTQRSPSPRSRGLSGPTPGPTSPHLLAPPLQKGPAGSLKLRPASTGRMGVQQQLQMSVGSAGAGAALAGGGRPALGASILERQLLGQPAAPAYRKVSLSGQQGSGGVGSGIGAGLVLRAPASPRGARSSHGGGGWVEGTGSQGYAYVGSFSRPASPAKVPAASQPASLSLRPVSPARVRMNGAANDNIRAPSAGSGQLNLSYYGIKP